MTPSTPPVGPLAKPSALAVRPFAPADADQVIELWRRCGLIHPTNDPRKDIARKMKVRPDLFLVGEADGAIVASVMGGYEGHRGAVNYLAVSPEHQGKGWGRAMMDELERLLRAEGCAKINLDVRTKNTGVVAFYRALGYTIDDVVPMGKRLESDQ